MAGIQTKRYGFNRQQTYWQQLEKRRERSKQFREDYEASNKDASTRLTTAWSGQVGGAGDLAAKTALARINAAAEAKVKENQAKAAANSVSVWKNKAMPTELSAGDTKIDLASNTLTLSDGTVIDIKTGVKKVNVTA